MNTATLAAPTAAPAISLAPSIVADGAPTSLPISLPAIGALFSGGVYAGIIRGVAGALDEHLILLPGEATDVTWDAAVEFATLAGGVLPTRREQALLFANLQDQFKRRWYWSGEQYAPIPGYAWLQNFDYGYQVSYYKSSTGRARAVRRLIIQ